jgi:hypothetical protein
MSTKRLVLPVAVACAAGAILASSVACAPPAPPADVPEAMQHVAEVHRAKCGNCHTRIEPGTHGRDQLETALSRHRNRLHLSEEEWGQLIEYLAQSPRG